MTPSPKSAWCVTPVHLLASATKGSLLVVALLVALTAGALWPSVVRAEIFQVDTTADDPVADDCLVIETGDCSLRGAISRANENPGPDTITFLSAPWLDGVPIVLGGAAGQDDNAGGDLDVLCSGGDLTIQGNGAANTIIDGGSIDRVFDFCPLGGSGVAISLSGVTIRDGLVDGIGGGMLVRSQAQVTVGTSIIHMNKANLGGGI